MVERIIDDCYKRLAGCVVMQACQDYALASSGQNYESAKRFLNNSPEMRLMTDLDGKKLMRLIDDNKPQFKKTVVPNKE